MNIIDKDSQLKAYPNPVAKGLFTIALPEKLQGEVHYSLLSFSGTRLVSGKFLLKKQATRTTFDFTKEMIASGIYYLVLEGKEFQGRVRLLKAN